MRSGSSSKTTRKGKGADEKSDPEIVELSLIFGAHKGKSWQPRNPGARVLAVKGASDPRMASVGDVISQASQDAGESAQRGEIMTYAPVPSLELQKAVNRANDPSGNLTGGAITVRDHIQSDLPARAVAAIEAARAR